MTGNKTCKTHLTSRVNVCGIKWNKVVRSAGKLEHIDEVNGGLTYLHGPTLHPKQSFRCCLLRVKNIGKGKS